MRRSEDDLASQLHDACRAGAGHLAEVRGSDIRAHRTGSSGNVRLSGIHAVLSVVEGVEGFQSQLEADSFRKLERLRKIHVPVVDSGLGQEITPRVTKHSPGTLAEGGCVEPLSNVLDEMWLSGNVRTHGDESGLEGAALVRRRNREREAPLEGGDNA